MVAMAGFTLGIMEDLNHVIAGMPGDPSIVFPATVSRFFY
jgi:hypothetical protein